MSRRAATFTQADVARALRAAQQVGPDWCVEVVAGVIRLTRAPAAGTIGAPPHGNAAPEKLDEEGEKWKLW